MSNDKFEIIRPYIKNKKVLDLGVVQHSIEKIENKNWLHRLIKKHSKKCVGIDIDREGIEYLKQRDYDVHVADAQDFNLHDKFDVVVAGDLIEHLANFDGFLQSVKKHLNHNSKFIITTPNTFHFSRFIEILFFGRASLNPEHTCWFDEETLRQLLNRYEFKIEQIYYTSGELYYRLTPLPKKLRHTTIVVVARYP